MTNRKKNKPSLKERFYAFFDKDFYDKLERAKRFYQILNDSTDAGISHFYNYEGEQIRGFSNTSIKTKRVEHPLIQKYR